MLKTVREYVNFQAETRPDAIYMIAPEPDLTMTFAELLQASRRLSHFLSCQGIQPGEKIALLMHNGYQTCRLFVGVIYAGYCVTPLNLHAHLGQLEYVLDHCDARIIFAAPDQMNKLRSALSNVKREIQIIECDVDTKEFLPPGEEIPADIREEDDALMMYTSGTTGKPKGVILTNRAVITGGQNVSAAHHLEPQDRVLGILPLYHINAQIVTATAPLIHGGSLILPHRFSASVFWKLAARFECTWLNVVPTIISYLIEADAPLPRGVDISRIRFCRSASAPLPPSQHRDFEEKFNIGVIETMGLTETAAPCFSNPLDQTKRKIGSPGLAFGNEAKIMDSNGMTLPPNVSGEIMIRGANVMKHYYKNPEETSKAFTKDGWLHTGDLGYLDDDGFVFVTGRIKELIIKGGENIAPREIDEVLIRHPAVFEAASVGIPDKHYGQEIMAFVVLKPETLCSENDLQEFCRQQLGAYKTPRIFRFLEELPKGPSGKVQRLKLIDQG